MTIDYSSAPQDAARAVRYQWCRLHDLSGPDVHALIRLREAVFVVEQHCAYQEADALDATSWHLVGRVGKEIAAYLRVTDPARKYAEPSIGRVLTAANYRGQGLGRSLVAEGIARTRAACPNTAIRISAQHYLLDFYRRFGFESVGETYLEDDIPHIEMLLAQADT